MACNCGKNRANAAQPRRAPASNRMTQEFALMKSDGSKETFGSRLEADAANARSGYRGVVKPVGQ